MLRFNTSFIFMVSINIYICNVKSYDIQILIVLGHLVGKTSILARTFTWYLLISLINYKKMGKKHYAFSERASVGRCERLCGIASGVVGVIT